MVKSSSTGCSIGRDACHRCGGFMISEKVFELGTFNWRCVSCGERVDPVILQHRREEAVRLEAERLTAAKIQSRLN